jgi:hypothetical protein
MLYDKVDNGFCAHAKCDFSANSLNDVEIVHSCACWVRLHDEVNGLCVVRHFGEVDLRPEIDIPRGSTLIIY